MWMAFLEQAGCAVGWYVAVLAIVRGLGKRFAGQTTGFDLLVLITLGVVLQTALLREGGAVAIVFVVTVAVVHRLNGWLCQRSRRVRRLVRGKPRPLVEHGRVDFDALDEEGLTHEDLLAGLRKVGCESPDCVARAVLEETGQISAVRR